MVKYFIVWFEFNESITVMKYEFLLLADLLYSYIIVDFFSKMCIE